MNCVQSRFSPLFLVLAKENEEQLLKGLNELRFYNSDFGIEKEDGDEYLSFRFLSAREWEGRGGKCLEENLQFLLQAVSEGKEDEFYNALAEFRPFRDSFDDVLDEPLACVLVRQDFCSIESLPVLNFDFDSNEPLKEQFRPFLLTKIFPFIQERIRKFAVQPKPLSMLGNWVLPFKAESSHSAQNIDFKKAAELLFLVHDWKGAKDLFEKTGQTVLLTLCNLMLGEYLPLDSTAFFQFMSKNPSRCLEFTLYIAAVSLEKRTVAEQLVTFQRLIEVFIGCSSADSLLVKTACALFYALVSKLFESIGMKRKASLFAYRAFSLTNKTWYLQQAISLWQHCDSFLLLNHNLNLLNLKTIQRKQEYLLNCICNGCVFVEGLEEALESLHDTFIQSNIAKVCKIVARSLASDGIITTGLEFIVEFNVSFAKQANTLQFINAFRLHFDDQLLQFPFDQQSMKQIAKFKTNVAGVRELKACELVLFEKVFVQCEIEPFSVAVEAHIPEVQCQALNFTPSFLQGEFVCLEFELVIFNPTEMKIVPFSPNGSMEFADSFLSCFSTTERLVLQGQVKLPFCGTKASLELELRYFSGRRKCCWSSVVSLSSFVSISFERRDVFAVKVNFEKAENVELDYSSSESPSFSVEFSNETLILEPVLDAKLVPAYLSKLELFFSGRLAELPPFPFELHIYFRWKRQKRTGMCFFTFNPSIDNENWLSFYCKGFKRIALADSILNNSQMTYNRLLWHYKKLPFSGRSPLWIKAQETERFTFSQSLMILQVTSIFPEPVNCSIELSPTLWIGQREFDLQLIPFERILIKSFYPGAPSIERSLGRMQVKIIVQRTSIIVFEGEMSA